MKTGIKVADAMTLHPIVVDPSTNLQECAKIMDNNHVGSLLVKENNKLVGVVTEQDIVRKAVAHGISIKIPVAGIMETKIKVIEPEKDIYDALIIMKDTNIRQLPVQRGRETIGLLTLKDILKIEPELFDLLVEKFELREESRKPISQFLPSEGICHACGKYVEKINDVKGSLLCDRCKREQIVILS